MGFPINFCCSGENEFPIRETNALSRGSSSVWSRPLSKHLANLRGQCRMQGTETRSVQERGREALETATATREKGRRIPAVLGIPGRPCREPREKPAQAREEREKETRPCATRDWVGCCSEGLSEGVEKRRACGYKGNQAREKARPSLASGKTK